MLKTAQENAQAGQDRPKRRLPALFLDNIILNSVFISSLYKEKLEVQQFFLVVLPSSNYKCVRLTKGPCLIAANTLELPIIDQTLPAL